MGGERKYEGVGSREGGIRIATVKVNRELGAAGDEKKGGSAALPCARALGGFKSANLPLFNHRSIK